MIPSPEPGNPRTRPPRGGPRLVLVATVAVAALVLCGLIPLFVAAPSAQAAMPTMTSYQPPDTPSPSVAGATTQFTTYQAPEGLLDGGASVVSETSAPTSKYDSPQGEATGHAYVQLTGTGQSVQWTNNTGQPINFINVRASIPDASTGDGITATLDLYVDGVFRQAISMNSIQSWEYEGSVYNGTDQNPADGDPRDFWDDFHAWVSGAAIPAGATFSLQRDSSNTASFYWVDSIDLWNAPAPAAQPANSISITSCGSTADDTPTNGTAAAGATDSTVDIQNCISQAEAKSEILWIPQGTFYLIGTSSLVVNNITVEGAGYLYSEIYRDVALPNNSGLGAVFQCYSCGLENIHIDSNALDRNTADGGGGAEDTTGTDWKISGMWVQHVESTVWASGSGGTVENNFFTDIFADGCNLNNVSLNSSSGSNLTATNNFIRGTGDDGMAINSVDYNVTGSTTTYYTAMSDITMSHNTVLGAWGGQGMAVYGGSGEVFEDNYIADTSRFVGLGVGRFSSNGSDMLGATITGNVIVRGGGNGFDQQQPAMMIGNVGNPTSTISGATGTVTNATVTDNTIIQSVYDGIGFSSSTDTDLADNTIIDPWLNGVVIAGLYYPSPTGNATITGNSVTGVSSGNSAFSNSASGFTATTSSNSWQNGNSEGAYGGTAAAVPGTVQAADYDTGGQGIGYNITSVNGSDNGYRSDGVDLEVTSDTGGGDDLGWTGTGQWFRYTVDAASAGTYTVTFRVASPNGVTDAFHLMNASGTELTGAENIPATGGFQTWTTITDTLSLSAGQQTLTLDQDNGGWNLHNLALALVSSAEGPYGGTAAAIPGTVQAADYDTGGQGVAYNVTSVNGSANSYRSDGVDLESCSDTDCGYNLGWTATGQWFNYTVDVATAGSYTVGLRLAAPSAVTDALHIDDSSGTNLSGDVNIPATGGWQDWETVNATVTLPAGVQTLALDQDNGGWNLHDLSFAATGPSASAWYEVVNENSSLCASAAGAGTANGTAVEQLACTGATSQLWQFVPTSVPGYYEVLNDNAQSAGESWNIAGGVSATASGDLLQTWNYGGTGNTNALFSADAQSNGSYNFIADNSGLCIDIPDASTASGVQLQQFTCNGTPAQAFTLVQE